MEKSTNEALVPLTPHPLCVASDRNTTSYY